MSKRCTCDPDEFGRHTPECALSPDTSNWLWYPASGEIEGGGVLVNPKDRSRICLLVRGYLAPARRKARN
jgi:hypothetical protein